MGGGTQILRHVSAAVPGCLAHRSYHPAARQITSHQQEHHLPAWPLLPVRRICCAFAASGRYAGTSSSPGPACWPCQGRNDVHAVGPHPRVPRSRQRNPPVVQSELSRSPNCLPRCRLPAQGPRSPYPGPAREPRRRVLPRTGTTGEGSPRGLPPEPQMPPMWWPEHPVLAQQVRCSAPAQPTPPARSSALMRSTASAVGSTSMSTPRSASSRSRSAAGRIRP